MKLILTDNLLKTDAQCQSRCGAQDVHVPSLSKSMSAEHQSKYSRTLYVTFAEEGLQKLTFTRHSWPLSMVGSLDCHTYCDTRHSLMIVISKDHDTHTFCRSFSSRASNTCFNDWFLRSVAAEIRKPTLPHAWRTL